MGYITYRRRVDKVSSGEWETDQTGVADLAGFWHCLVHGDDGRDGVMPEPALEMPPRAGLESMHSELSQLSYSHGGCKGSWYAVCHALSGTEI